MPAIWLRDGELREFGWSNKATIRGSTAIASLQLYVAMLTQPQELWRDDECLLVCEETYNRLGEITGLSRALVAEGVEGLVAADRIVVEKEGRNNRYIFPDFEQGGHWCKLPARALYNGRSRVIEPFQLFHKRSKCELDALKLFLFYAANRDNYSFHSMCSFETIYKKTGVPEKRIPAANAFLVSTGLLMNITREKSDEKAGPKKEANQYFLRGNRDLLLGSKVAVGKMPAKA
jgi:hypothetical protein